MEYYRDHKSFDTKGYHYAEFRFKFNEVLDMTSDLLKTMRYNASTVHPTVNMKYPTTFRVVSTNENEFCDIAIDFYNEVKLNGFRL